MEVAIAHKLRDGVQDGSVVDYPRMPLLYSCMAEGRKEGRKEGGREGKGGRKEGRREGR